MSRTHRAIPALAALALTLTGCGAGNDPLSSSAPSGSASSSSAVTVGSANFPESELLAEIYSQALEGAGVTVKRQFNIGAREVYLKALQDGSIDLVPEYNGALLSALKTGGAPKGVTSSQQVHDALQAVLPKGTETLEQSAAEDKDTLSVTQATADKYQLKSIADLKGVAGKLVVGAGPEWEGRYQGLVGLKDVYGVQFKQFKPLDAGGPLTVGALKSGRIDVGNIFSTDSAIPTNHFVVLDDPEHLYTAQNVLPLIRSAKNSAKVTSTLNAVSKALTTQNLSDSLAKVQVDKQDSATVAKEFLSSTGVK